MRPAGWPVLPLPERTGRIALGIIVSAAILLRLAYLLEYRTSSIFYGRLMLDAQVYDLWAVQIASGEWIGGPAFYHAPLYPYLLALFFRFLGHHFLPVYLFQMALGTAAILLAYRIGRRCSSPVAGLVAAALLVLYAPLPFFEAKILSTSVAVTLSVAALALLAEAWERGGILRWIGAGALVGAAALAHPASLLLAPVFATAILVRTRRLHEAAALAAGAILAVAPATIHNLTRGGGFVLISSQGGITFMQGNSPKSRGLYRPVEGFSGSPLTQEQEERSLAEKALGRPLTTAQVSGYWFGKGVEAIRAHPGDFLELLQLKLLRWFSSHEYSTEYSLSYEREQLLTPRLPFLPFGFLAAAAMAGVWLGGRAYPRLTPVYLYLLATAAPPLLFYVSSRYRIAAVPALAILGGVALERLAARVKTGGALDALPAASGILFVGALTLVPYGRDHEYQEANVHYNLGNLLYEAGDYDQAIPEYRRALAVSDFEFYRINLGNALARKGRFDEAIDQYRQVAAKKPGFAKAHIQWAKALADQGKIEEARERYRTATALGSISSELEARLGVAGAGPAGEGVEAVRRAVAEDPGNASLHNSLGIALQKAGSMEEAEKEYRTASELDPSHEKSHFNLGLLLEARGRPEEAMREYEMAVRINPAYARARLKAGTLLLVRGERERAREHFIAVLKIDPQNSEALDLLRRAGGGP